MVRENLKTQKVEVIMSEEMLNNETQNNETTEMQNNTAKPEQAEEKKLSIEEQLQQLMIENAKLRKATDKATSEAAGFKRQLREKQSADEIALQEKAEREAEREEKFNQLMRENKINKLEKNFLVLGYNEVQANKAATAQYDGDTDTLFKIQNEVQTALIKSKEAEWLKSRPPVNAGVGNNNEDDAFLRGFNSK